MISNRSLTHAALACLVALIAAACAGIGSLDESDLATRPVAVDTARAVSLVNAYRAQNHLPPLRLDPKLSVAAQDMANIIARRGDLKTPEHNARCLARRLDQLGYDNLAAAENIGGGYATLEAVIEGWKGSADHDKNLKNPYVTRFGIARANSQGGTWTTFWAMILALPREDYRPGASPFQ